MDPQATWFELMNVFQSGDWKRVRDLAEALLQWLNRGGFPPETLVSKATSDGGLSGPPQSLGPGWNRVVSLAASRYALDLANSVLEDPNGIPNGVPFILSCQKCNVSCSTQFDEALEAGWNEIRFTPQRVGETFLGLCPNCLTLISE